MPKINTYPIKATPDGAEIVTGFDPNNSDAMNNFTLQSIADLAAGGGGISIKSFGVNSFTGPDWVTVNTVLASSTNSDISFPVEVDNVDASAWFAEIKLNFWFKRVSANGGFEAVIQDVENNTAIVKFVGGSGAPANIDTLEDKWKPMHFTFWDTVLGGVKKDYGVRIQSSEQDFFMTNPYIQVLALG